MSAVYGKPRGAKIPRAALPAEALRLLEALAQPNAYGVESEPPGRLQVVAPRNNVSVRMASVTPAAGAALLADDLAVWESPGRSNKRRMVLTEPGRAHLARHASQMTETSGVTPFRAQHGAIRAGDTAAHVPAVERAESPLAWLAIRKGRDGKALVDPASLEAGERLRRDLTAAQMVPRLSANWSPTPRSDPSGTPMNYTDAVIAARQRARNALDATGPEFSGVLLDVCGFLKGMETLELERGWPARSAKVVLGMALKSLARHYGTEVETTGRTKAPMRHWGTEDFRPTM